MARIPNFLRPTLEVTRERMRNTVQKTGDNKIYAIPGNPAYPALAEAILKMQTQVAERLNCPSIIISGGGHQIGRTFAQERMMANVGVDLAMGENTSTYTCGAICGPHRNSYNQFVNGNFVNDEPQRRRVDSREVEVKLLTGEQEHPHANNNSNRLR